MAPTPKTVTLGRATVNCRCHVCAFFNNRDDEYKVMLPFFKEGLEAGEKTVYILDQNLRSERLQRLAVTGFDTAEAEASGQLELRLWENAPLQPGRFDQHAMIDLIEEVAKAAKRCATRVTRLWINMELALLDSPVTHDIAEYESRLNYFLPDYDMATVCSYDVTKLGASVVIDILRTHPYIVAGGVLRESPFYVPPDEFLHELDARKSSTTPSRVGQV
jgi:MEDS: MEthanogen/methylotroph, DcmR Sensory domain